MVSSSTLYSIAGAFPGAEGYAEIEDVQYVTGGEAANSSIVLARLGAQVKLDGNWLGSDAGGDRTTALLTQYGIDISRLPQRHGYTGVQEVVFVAPGTRTIFGSYGHLLEQASWNMPHEEDILGARAICLDPFFSEASLRVAELGCHANIPVITVDCRHDHPLVGYASALVISESFLRENYQERKPDDVFREYRQRASGLVVFTFGDTDIWYGRHGQDVQTLQPPRIDPVDTCGAGDSFRAAVVYGFLQSWNDRKMIEYAAAVAAMICTRFPGVLNAPTREEVAAFMKQNHTSHPGD